MKKIIVFIIIVIMTLNSCSAFHTGEGEGEDMGYDYYAINMLTDYEIVDTLPSSNGERARVIILIGQSNATGCSLTSYLQENVDEQSFLEYSEGYDSVLINFSLDNQTYTSNGEFVEVDLNCAAGEGYFGPEVGMAEVLSEKFPDEKIFILKFSMSGYSLNYHWLYNYERASIYKAFIPFVNTYMGYILSKGYDATVDAICWMQGESDTTEYKASRYYENLSRFTSYLRSDLSRYAGEGGIYFIDAGISSSPYCEPAYPEINEAKERFADTSEMNLYFSTIDAGLTTLYEPESNPDLGHYDALSMLELGRTFGREIAGIYEE